MKILIITAAGMSTRFSRSVGKDVIKCLYTEGTFSDTLMSRMLRQPCGFDRYIIVGGYRFGELEAAVRDNFPDIADRLDIVENVNYEKYGSGYSLYCGMKKAMEYSFDEIVFAEGDLFVDTAAYSRVCGSEKSVITCNNEPICADKAVALYFDVSGKPHYIYDTSHGSLEIREPFISVYNSGQIWKFAHRDCVCEVYNNMDMTDWEGTNLVFVEKYFNAVSPHEIEMIRFDDWINCNTVDDFRKIKEISK